MSLLAVGTRCDACALVDFLPFTCPSCSHTFCQAHIHAHTCPNDDDDKNNNNNSNMTPVAGPSKPRKRGQCALLACSGETLESVGGLEAGVTGAGIAREVKCDGCREAYCIQHRSQDSHACPAPREDDARHDAALARQARAREILSKNFPVQAARERIKIPPQVDRTRVRRDPSPHRLSPSVQTPLTSSPSIPSPTKTTPSPVVKSKEVKLYEIHVRKVRMAATPLDARQASALPEERRWFEWAVDENGEMVKAWRSGGKCAVKARTWVPQTMPGGKALDLIVTHAKVNRGPNTDPIHALSLLCLAAAPHAARLPVQIDLSQPLGGQVIDGDTVVLVRGFVG